MVDTKQQSSGATGHQLAGAIGAEGADSNEVYETLRKELKDLESKALTITVFGASGHLARTKTIPAMFKLYSRGILPANTKIVGYARSKLGDSGFRDKVKPALTESLMVATAEQLTPSMVCHEEDCDHPHHHDAASSSSTGSVLDKVSEVANTLASHVISDKTKDSIKATLQTNPATHALNVQRFLQMMHYVDGQYDKAEDIQKLNKYLEDIESKHEGKGNRIFYLAIPPEIFGKVSGEIKKYAFAKDGWTRVAVEKPFGRNQEEAKQLNKEIFENFEEDQIYRVDHFLGKDQVQQIPLLRFTNTLLNPLWNKEYVSAVMIVFKETAGVEGRGGYFDDYGIIRDVVQNHLLHIVAFLAMEAPEEFSIEGIRKAKSKAMYDAEPVKMENIVVGQYKGGTDPKTGKKQPSYREDKSTKDDSLATTFALQVFYINNERWKGVPFVIYTGKALNEAKSEARVQFKQTPDAKKLFKTAQRNEIIIDVAQSNIALNMNIKAPGLVQTPIRTDLDLNPTSHDQLKHTMSAYERVVLDLMRGDRSLFVSAEEQDAMWRIVQPSIDKIEKDKIEPKFYEFGSGGPKEAADLLNKLDIEWSGDLLTL